MTITLPAPKLFSISLAVLFALLFVLGYGSTSVLSAWVPWHIAPALAFEADIPLKPAWSVVYLSMPLMLFWSLVCLDWKAQWSLFAILVVELLVACVLFILLPVKLSYPAHTVTGIWQPWFELATTLNLQNNHFPSLHVAFACTAGMALHNALPIYKRMLVWLWVLLVAVSTVWIHEHHLFDIAGGIFLAIAAQKMVPIYTTQSHVIQRVRLEWLWWYNQYLFTRRHQRYGGIALMIAIQRLLHPKRGHLLVSGYCFLQSVDDVIDGDRTSSTPRLQMVDGLIAAWQQQQFHTDDDFMLLAQDFYTRLQHTASCHIARNEVITLLQVMRQDYLRAAQREIWTAEKLQHHHNNTFALSLNLLLSALSSKTRAQDIPELIAVLGWCSTMRDLREDLQAGIINIPAEVISPPQYAFSNQQDINALLQQPPVIEWMQQQHQQACDMLNALDKRLPTMQLDATGNRIVHIFAKSVRDFAESRFSRLYPKISL